jgi:ribosome biogenesis GTPase / thiamine phosphate phosphatase
MTKSELENLPDKATGTVIRLSRRYALVRPDDLKLTIIRCHILNKFDGVMLGDRVELTKEQEGFTVSHLYERSNTLSRSYFNRTKHIAANIDHLFIVTAPPPLFNTHFVDRVLTAAFQQGIATSLILNKVDLKNQAAKDLVEVYQALGLSVLETQAKTGVGIDSFTQSLHDNTLKITVFCGISGVGKSTLLNALIPGAARETGDVSRKTGQGRQTTSQSEAYTLERSGMAPLFVVDTPGVQNFGLTHLQESDVRDAFPDFLRYHHECRFHNCLHLQEEECGVKAALKSGNVAHSRYESYLHIIEEIRRAKPF